MISVSDLRGNIFWISALLIMVFVWNIAGVCVYAETLDEAVLRSGVVVGNVEIPPILKSGSTYTIRWMVQSYVPILSRFQITYPDGTKVTVDGILYDTRNGDYYISDYHSGKYYFQANYTVPYNMEGEAKIGFHNSQEDGAYWMYGLFPTGIISRPYGVAGKQYYVSICTQDAKGGQCVTYVRNHFGGSSQTMPALCQFNADCGAYNAYEYWDLGFGKGKVPEANSIMVLDHTTGMPTGHVAVVIDVTRNFDGTYSLSIQESNWDYDERVDCNVTYHFDAETLEVTRAGGGTRYPVLGFIYGTH